MTNDNKDKHLEKLMREHRDLDSEIKKQQKRLQPDWLEIGALKRKKLAKKEEIESYKRRSKRPPRSALSAVG